MKRRASPMTVLAVLTWLANLVLAPVNASTQEMSSLHGVSAVAAGSGARARRGEVE